MLFRVVLTNAPKNEVEVFVGAFCLYLCGIFSNAPRANNVFESRLYTVTCGMRARQIKHMVQEI